MANNNTNNNGNSNKVHPNVNYVILNGRLTQNARFRAKTDDKQAMLSFTIANNEGFLKADGTESVSFIGCQMFGERAEKIAPYMTQGTKLTVIGHLRAWSTKNQAGQYENNYAVVVDTLEFHTKSQSEPKEAPMPQPQATQAPAQNQYAGQQAMPTQAPYGQAAPAQYQPAPVQQMPQQAQATPAPFGGQPQATQPVGQFQMPAQDPFSGQQQAAPAFTYSNDPFSAMESANFVME